MGNLDFQSIKERLDLLTEIEKDLGPGHKSGRWVIFSCPFPGHRHGDRKPALSVTPDNGRFYCFACGRSGDVITWLLDYRGLTWRYIGDLAGSDSLPPPRPRPAAELQQPTPSGPPPPAWQERGESFVRSCEESLWEPGGVKALRYLRRRGLDDRTIRRYRMGYNPEDCRDPWPAWGLPDNPDSKGLWLPRGVVIPCFVGGVLWYVKIRRPVENPKYLNITGGKAALFGADNLRGAEIALLTEGELDCILVDQALGDVLGAATLGSAGKKLDILTWGVYLLPVQAILAAYDLDEAGGRGLAELMSHSSRIHPVRVPALRPGDKDITDYTKAGGDLWEWLKYNLDLLGLLPSNDSSSLLPAGVEVAGRER